MPKNRCMPPRSLLLAAAALLFACGPAKPSLPDRKAGERKPLSGACDPADPLRCGLPWPSNVFTVSDETSETKLRLAIDPKAMPLRDDVARLNHADGFSRLSPIATAFPGAVQADTVEGALVLLVAQPGAEDDGQSVPLHVELIASESANTGTESLLIGYPLRPLSANADHLALVLDSVKAADGSSFSADRLTKLALGLETASNEEEEARVAYFAPARAALKSAGIDPAHVLRVWDFTTRSEHDARWRLEAMRDAVQAAVKSGSVQVVLDTVTFPATANVAAVVEGRLTGVPDFRDADGFLHLDGERRPQQTGVHDAPFRVMIPKGSGNYRVVLYGHGTGGNQHDDLFDDRLGEIGLGKVSGLFYGWNDAVVLDTFLSLTKMIHGVAKSSSGLMQALADYGGLEVALDGVLGDALSAAMLKDQPNPAAGRRPDAKEPIWTGGSLGGTMGLVYAGLSPRVKHAVLNVPGAAWTHFVPGSDMYELIRPGLQGGYPSPLDFRYALLASQLVWDDVDGGNFADGLQADGSVYLLQESIGDSVLPNPGSAMVATSVRAEQVGVVLSPIVGVSPVDSADQRSAITQYKVDATGAFDRHGFASKNTPAGNAAREQISSFISSVLAGHPRIELPSGCAANTVAGSCDFSTAP